MRNDTIHSIVLFLTFLIVAAAPAVAPAQELAKSADSYQELIRKNFEVRKELRVLEEKYQSLENERRVLILHVEELQAAKAQTVERIKELQNMVASLRDETRQDPQMADKIDGLNRRMEAAVEERDHLKDKITRLESELETAQQEREETGDKAARAEERNRRLADEITRMREGYDRDEAGLKKALADLDLEKQALAKSNRDMRQELDAKRVELGQEEQAVQSGLKETEAEKARLEEKVKALLETQESQRRDHLRSEEELLAQIKGGEKEVAALKTRIAGKNTEIEKLTRDVDTAGESLRRQVKELEERLVKSRGEKRALEAKVRGLEASDGDREKTPTGSDAGMASKVREKEEEVARLKGMVWDKNAEIQKLTRELETSGGGLRKRVEELEARLERSLADKAGARERARALASTQEELQADLSQSGLKAMIRDKEKEIIRLREEAAAVDAKIARCERDAGAAQAKADRLAAALEERQAALRERERAMGVKLRGMEEKNARLVRDLRREGALLEAAEAKWQEKVDAAGQENTRIEKELIKAGLDNKNLNAKLARLEQEVRESEDINRRLMQDLKDEQEALAKTDKALKLEGQKRAIEKETFDARLRNTMKDKAMFEARITEMEERIVLAEDKQAKASKESAQNAQMLEIRQSEVAELRDAKARLEAKLVRYIEKIIALSRRAQARQSFGQDGDAEEIARDMPYMLPSQWSPRAQRQKSRKEISEQKLKMHYNLALAYDRMGMFREEEREYIKCLKINPRDANAHYNLAILYDDKLDQNGKAITHYQKYLDLLPEGDEAHEVKSWILYAEQENRLKTQMK